MLETLMTKTLYIDGVPLENLIKRIFTQMLTTKNSYNDKEPGQDSEKKTIKAPGVIVTQTIPVDFTDTRNHEKKRQYENFFLRYSMAGSGSFAEYKRIEIAGRRLSSHNTGEDYSHDDGECIDNLLFVCCFGVYKTADETMIDDCNY